MRASRKPGEHGAPRHGGAAIGVDDPPGDAIDEDLDPASVCVGHIAQARPGAAEGQPDRVARHRRGRIPAAARIRLGALGPGGLCRREGQTVIAQRGMVLLIADHAGQDRRGIERRDAGRGKGIQADEAAPPIDQSEHMRARPKAIKRDRRSGDGRVGKDGSHVDIGFPHAIHKQTGLIGGAEVARKLVGHAVAGEGEPGDP